MKNKIIILFTLLITGLVSAQDNFMVDLKVHNNSELLGTPSLMVEKNKQASVSINDSYTISFTVTDYDENSVYIPFKLIIDGKEHSPSMLVSLGKEASIEMGKIKLSVLVSKAST